MGSTLTVDNLVGATTAANVKLPAGYIVQSVSFQRPGSLGSTSSIAALSSSTFVDVMSKAITTKFANSQIYVAMSIVAYDGTASTRAMIRVYRDSTIIDSDKYAIYCPQSTMQNYQIFILDSPSASAGTALTYKLQAARQTGSSSGLTIGYGDSGGGSSASIILMEIAQ